jgi:hypothetical protein
MSFQSSCAFEGFQVESGCPDHGPSFLKHLSPESVNRYAIQRRHLVELHNLPEAIFLAGQPQGLFTLALPDICMADLPA